MPEHQRSAVAGTTAMLVCAVSSVNAYTATPMLRAHARPQALAVRAARRVAPVGPSMIYTPPRIDENDAVAVANLKRSLDRLVELPSAEPSDHVVSAPARAAPPSYPLPAPAPCCGPCRGSGPARGAVRVRPWHRAHLSGPLRSRPSPSGLRVRGVPSHCAEVGD